MSKGWDNATLKKLKALTGKGLSTSEIGKRLGMSKNAIVGKLNRLGWNAKAGGAGADKKVSATTKSTTKKTTAVKGAAVKKATATKAAAKKATATTKKATAAKTATKTAAKATAKKATATKAAATTTKRTESAKKAAAPAPKAEKTAKTNAKTLAMHQRIIQHSLEMANLKPNQCRWPIGDPDSEHFHFCGETVFVGKPYCYEHCKQAYQFAPPKKK